MMDLSSILLNEKQVLSPEAKEVITRAIPHEQIKQRDAGFGKKLSYISGSTVIALLNQAFNYRWSFIVKDTQLILSAKKKDGKEQPPYIQVLGQLILPDLGVVKEQYGTKILIGGASEQEGAAKAAATDALKKCATLVGIGLELYDDSDIPADRPADRPVTPPKTPAPTPGAVSLNWDPDDIGRLKELKAILDINDNVQLDAYVKEFIGDANATYKNVTPLNVKKFNKFLQEKAERV